MSSPIDYEKIKKAAQLSVEREFKIPEAGDEDRRYTGAEMAWLEFVSLATPATVLAIIAEKESLLGLIRTISIICDIDEFDSDLNKAVVNLLNANPTKEQAS